MSTDDLNRSASDEANKPVGLDDAQGSHDEKDLGKILGGDDKEAAQKEDKVDDKSADSSEDAPVIEEVSIEQPVVEGEVPSDDDDFSDIDESFGLDTLPEEIDVLASKASEKKEEPAKDESEDESEEEGEDKSEPESDEKDEEDKATEEDKEVKASASDDGKVAPAPIEEQKIEVLKDGKEVESLPEEGSPEIKEEPKEEKVSALIDPLKAEIEVNGPAKEDVAEEDKELPESLEAPLSATAAANIKPDVKELTISSLEACPKDAAYEAKIIQPGKKAILFAVDANGNFKPVLELNAQYAAESNARFFQSQSDLDRVIYEITKDRDFRPELKDFAALGARDFKFTAPVSDVLHNRIESGIANVTASLKREDEEHVERIAQSLKIAFLELVKGVREDVPNAVREELVARIRALGVEDAAHIVDNAFRDAGEQFAKDLLRRTLSLAEKSVEVRNEAAENAVQAKFKREDGHVSKAADVPNQAVASALHAGSTPFHGSPVQATASSGSDFMARFGHMLHGK